MQSIKYLRFLRQLLIDGGDYADGVEVMERTLCPRGRPEVTSPMATISAAVTRTPERGTREITLLLALKRHHPEELLSLSKTKGVIRDAAIKVGVIIPARREWSAFMVFADIGATKRLP